MRSCGLLLLVACSGDPSLAIAVHHPPAITVKQTVVTVYVGDSISCSEIEFGDRTDAELAAITADEVDVTRGARVDVPRLGGKSIVARGFDDQHRFVTAGCKDAGELTAGTHVTIDTQPTAVVALDPGQPELPFTGRPILVHMSDINGVALDGTVSWQMTGPVGAPVQQPSAGITTRNGDAKIRVDDLGTPGPEGLRIRVPWAIAPLPLVTGFDLSHRTTIPLTLPGGGGLGGPPSCDVRGHAGKLPTLVCLNQADPQGHRNVVELAWQIDHYAIAAITIPAGIDNQFALFVDHDGSTDEPVYVLGANALGAGYWYKLGAPAGTPLSFGAALQNVVYVPRCDGPDNLPTALVAVQTGATTLANKLAYYKPAGQPVTTPQPGEVFSAGCVADVDKHEHQAVVISDGITDTVSNATLVLVGLDPSTRMFIQGSKLTGSGFVAADTQGVLEKRFAGTRLQASGAVVFEAVLALENAQYKLIERTEVDAAAPPDKIIGGKLDKDGGTDLMWNMGANPRRELFQVSLSEQVSGTPLTAITGGPAAGSTAATKLDFLAGDLDGGGIDEVVVFASDAITIYSADE